MILFVADHYIESVACFKLLAIQRETIVAGACGWCGSDFSAETSSKESFSAMGLGGEPAERGRESRMLGDDVGLDPRNMHLARESSDGEKRYCDWVVPVWCAWLRTPAFRHTLICDV